MTIRNTYAFNVSEGRRLSSNLQAAPRLLIKYKVQIGKHGSVARFRH